jgi:hypothetical protein
MTDNQDKVFSDVSADQASTETDSTASAGGPDDAGAPLNEDAPGTVGTDDGAKPEALSPTGQPVASASAVDDANDPVDDGYEPKVNGAGNAEADRVAELYQSVTDEKTGAVTGTTAKLRTDHESPGKVGETGPANPDTAQSDLPDYQQTTDSPTAPVSPPGAPAG